MIESSIADGIALIRLAHGKVSAMDLELATSLTERLRQISNQKHRALILTGTGSAFSAGVDLKRILDGGEGYLARFMPAFHELMELVFAYPRPVVAAINGHAIAGGCVLACAADHRLMANGKGRIGVTELVAGVPFPTIALEVMRHAVGHHHLQPLMYSGTTVTADDALKVRLIDEVCLPNVLLDRAQAVARHYAAIPPATFALTKRQLRTPVLERIEQTLPTVEPEVIATWNRPEVRARIQELLDGLKK